MKHGMLSPLFLNDLWQLLLKKIMIMQLKLDTYFWNYTLSFCNGLLQHLLHFFCRPTPIPPSTWISVRIMIRCKIKWGKRRATEYQSNLIWKWLTIERKMILTLHSSCSWYYMNIKSSIIFHIYKYEHLDKTKYNNEKQMTIIV